jgi:hypothetical protein
MSAGVHERERMTLGGIAGQASMGYCYLRAIGAVVGGLLMMGIGIFLFAYEFEARERVAVQVLGADSSHHLELRRVGAIRFPREERVSATFVEGSSRQLCQQTESLTRSTPQKCQCSGYEFEHNGARVACPGHQGMCDQARPGNNIVRVARATGEKGELECRASGEIRCTYELDDGLVVGPCETDARACNAEGTQLKFPVSGMGQVECPSKHWNTCSMRIEYDGRQYDFEKQSDRDCATLVGRPMELYYSEERDNFALTHDDPTPWVRLVAGVLVLLAFLSFAHAFVTVRYEWACHVQNATSALDMLTTRRRAVTTVI